MNIDIRDPEFALLERTIVMQVLQGAEIDDADLRACAFNLLLLATTASIAGVQESALDLIAAQIYGPLAKH
jgi:hypothetical protein